MLASNERQPSQSIDSSITKDSNVVSVNQKDDDDEELNVMLMLIDKAKELEQQKHEEQKQQQTMIKKEIVKELDEIKVEKVEVYTDHHHQKQQPSKQVKKSAHKVQGTTRKTIESSQSIPMERLLPVGGELCEAIHTSLQRRPLYPSMLQQSQSMDMKSGEQQTVTTPSSLG
ncbi:hypothetical protein BLA29_010805, partial [Euroglyphus maynei]